MGEYVRRSDALQAVGDVHPLDYNGQGIVARIKAIPAADVVEVIRCRECVYWRGENDICKGICIDFSADGYCSEGKRKDGGQDDDC